MTIPCDCGGTGLREDGYTCVCDKGIAIVDNDLDAEERRQQASRQTEKEAAI